MLACVATNGVVSSASGLLIGRAAACGAGGWASAVAGVLLPRTALHSSSYHHAAHSITTSARRACAPAADRTLYTTAADMPRLSALALCVCVAAYASNGWRSDAIETLRVYLSGALALFIASAYQQTTSSRALLAMAARRQSGARRRATGAQPPERQPIIGMGGWHRAMAYRSRQRFSQRQLRIACSWICLSSPYALGGRRRGVGMWAIGRFAGHHHAHLRIASFAQQPLPLEYQVLRAAARFMFCAAFPRIARLKPWA